MPRLFSIYEQLYLTHELGETFVIIVSCCNTIDQLRLIMNTIVKLNQIDIRKGTEIRTLYDALVPDYASAKVLGSYYKYMRSNGVTIDFNQWMEHESSPLLAVLEYIQPVKDTDN